MKPVFDEVLEAQIIEHEGLELEPYRCSAGKLTIGVGRNIEDRGISKDEALYLLRNDIAECLTDLSGFGWWDALSLPRKRALIDMRFNLGASRFRQFRRMLNALTAGDYRQAAAQMRASKWATQVGRRAEKLAGMMERG